MPRYGLINERRNQLHEVIRLSGMNLIIDDTDHPLVIKVASIQSARMQVYFIDNEDFFGRKSTLYAEGQAGFPDNDARAIFYVRGVLETIKKLRWIPDVIHCHGWFTALVPLYLKRLYGDDPCFMHTKVVYSLYADSYEASLGTKLGKKLRHDGATAKDVRMLGACDCISLNKVAMLHADGVIQGSESIAPELSEYIVEIKKRFLPYQSEGYIPLYNEFYETLLAGK
jgi:starch synthase